MKKFRCLRPFALLLSLLMLIYAFPFSTTALTTTDASDIAAEPTNDIGASLSDIIDTEAISGVREVTDLREENVKHFALPDGTYTAITYANPVHRKDENGIWQDIDNTLSMKAVKNKERYATSDMRVSFSKAFSEGEALFALTENGYTIQMAPFSWGSNTGTSVMALTPSENKTVTVSNTEKRVETQRFDTIEEAAAVNNKSSIVYENVKTNTDLEYVLDGNNVKENIIVKSAGGNYVYRFTLSLTGLSAALLPSGDISLTDSETGAPKYTIPAPYMYDANGTLSHDVHYTLTPAGSGSYTLTVTASPEWINAEDRAFPVVIDPTVKNTTQIFDTYILSTAPDSNYETETYLSVNDNTILYFLWAYPDIPDNATITNASLHVKPVNLDSDGIILGVYKMLESFLPYSITWNSAAAMTNFGMASSSLRATTLTENGVYTAINLTTFVKQWYANPSSNYGIAIKKIGGSSNNTLLYSCDTGSDNQAYFSVTYRLFEDGIYFIQNVATGKYLALAGPSASEGAYVQQQDFLGGDHLRWQLTHDSSGNIKIQSVYSDRYITTNSASSSVTQTQTLNDYSSWAFYQTDSGNYRIFCTAFPTRAYNTICARSDTNGVYMARYTDDNGSYDEWKLYRGKDVSLIAVPLDHDRSSYFSNIISDLSSIGYTDSFNNHTTISSGMTEAELLQRMKYSKIVLLRTHGSKIVVQVTPTNGDTYLSLEDLLDLPSNTFAGTELIIYGACSTGEGGKTDSNMVTATVAAGARTAIGFENIVGTYSCNDWCELFFEYYAEYYTSETMTYEALCNMVVSEMVENGYQDHYNSEGELVSIRNAVVAGESTFP